MTRFYTVEQLGPKRHRTPEGYLVCEDVPLARVGEQIYGPGETPVQPNRQGFVRIMREAEEVFRPETVSSALGKPLTNDHPDTNEVTPDTWLDHSRGIVLNPHRGAGDDADVLLGDILVTTRDQIDLIESGKVQVSCGYDCDYDELGEPGSGLGRQRNIVINHVALVDQGRCGPRCAIGDTAMTERTAPMRTADKRSTWDKFSSILDRAFKAKDEKEKEAIKEEMKEVAKDEASESGHLVEVHNHMPAGDENTFEERMKKVEDACAEMKDTVTKVADAVMKLAGDKKASDGEGEGNKAILGELEMEAPPGAGDRARKAKDSAFLEDSYQKTVADAEILAPGLRMPTFDRAADPAKSLDSICQLRRKALDAAYLDRDTHIMIDQILAGRALDTKGATCGDVRAVFNAAAAMKRAANNGANTRDADRIGDAGKGSVAVRTIADINRLNAERYRKTG